MRARDKEKDSVGSRPTVSNGPRLMLKPESAPCIWTACLAQNLSHRCLLENQWTLTDGCRALLARQVRRSPPLWPHRRAFRGRQDWSFTWEPVSEGISRRSLSSIRFSVIILRLSSLRYRS